MLVGVAGLIAVATGTLGASGQLRFAVLFVAAYLLVTALLRIPGQVDARRREGRYRVDAERVVFEPQSSSRQSRWEEPLNAYKGVRWMSANHAKEDRVIPWTTRGLFWNALDLVHDDPARRVPLAAGVSGDVDKKAFNGLLRDAFSTHDADESLKAQSDAVALLAQATNGPFRAQWLQLSESLDLSAIDDRCSMHKTHAIS